MSPDPGASQPARIGILISGRGSNMVALVDAVRDKRIPRAEVAVVISDQPDADGLSKAKERGIETLAIERRGRTRTEHDREVVAALQVAAYRFGLSGRLHAPSFRRVPGCFSRPHTEYSSKSFAFVSRSRCPKQHSNMGRRLPDARFSFC